MTMMPSLHLIFHCPSMSVPGTFRVRHACPVIPCIFFNSLFPLYLVKIKLFRQEIAIYSREELKRHEPKLKLFKSKQTKETLGYRLTLGSTIRCEYHQHVMWQPARDSSSLVLDKSDKCIVDFTRGTSTSKSTSFLYLPSHFLFFNYEIWLVTVVTLSF